MTDPLRETNDRDVLHERVDVLDETVDCSRRRVGRPGRGRPRAPRAGHDSGVGVAVWTPRTRSPRSSTPASTTSRCSSTRARSSAARRPRCSRSSPTSVSASSRSLTCLAPAHPKRSLLEREARGRRRPLGARRGAEPRRRDCGVRPLAAPDPGGLRRGPQARLAEPRARRPRGPARARPRGALRAGED